MLLATGVKDVFPFIVPVLERLFRVRNVLAHSVEARDDDPDALILVSRHRGRHRTVALSFSELEWLVEQGAQVCGEVMIVSGALADCGFMVVDDPFEDHVTLVEAGDVAAT